MKKTISVILTIVMMLSVFTISPITASALTQNDVVSWMNSKNGSTIYDGGTQCVAAFNSYLRLFGISNPISKYPVNYAYQIFNYNAPDGWQKISGNGNYQVGDVVIWGSSIGGGCGHVGMVYSTSGGTVKIFDQNYVAKNVCGIHNIAQTSAIRGVFRPPLNSGNNPTGCLDELVGGTGTVTVSGWAFDFDDNNAQLNIHVYIGGQAGDSNAEGYGYIIANEGRGDVNAAYGCGDYHGFSSTIFTSKTGTQPVYVYAINVGGGENVCIGSGTVNITADTEKPTVETKYLSQITADSFRVCIIPKDNVGIKKVRIATWTQLDQSDLIWHDAMYNGYGTYFIDLQRSDYSKTSNTIYHNHAYVYDYSGNVGFAGIAMDYRVKSDTGKTINDGEYRIVTSVDESKALDIAGGKNSNGTNIQIYSNINDPNQTFDIQYINDGFYTVFSHSAKKSIDVEGDTYQSGTNVAIYDYHEGANQQWIIKHTDDGYYTIVARSNGLALDLANAKNEDGANVQVHTVNNSAAQKWKLRRVIKSEMVNVSNLTIDKNTLTLNPEIQVIVDDNTLVLNKDYKVEVNGDIESGTGTVTVTGIGDYCDSVSKSFEINQYEIGDVNNDGSVNITDTTSIQKHLASINTLDENALIRADVNSDSSVDIKDATLIQQYCAGLIDKF